MAEIEIDFGTNRIFPNNPKHAFAGFVFVPYCAIFTPKYYPIKK